MYHHTVHAALGSLAEIFFARSRRTGRTAEMLDSLKSGDFVIFDNAAEAKRVQQLAARRGIKIETVVARVSDHHRWMDRARHHRLVFDHAAIEKYYFEKMQEATNNLDEMIRFALPAESDPEEKRERGSFDFSGWTKC